MSVVAEHVAAVEAENDQLRARIAELEKLLGMTLDVPPIFGLTATEGRLFSFLLSREVVTKDAVMTCLYGHRTDDDPEVKIVDVYICKLRKKLKPFGISIETKHGVGYSMPKASKDAAFAMLVGRNAA